MDGFMSRKAKSIAATPFAVALLGGTILAGVPVAASAQDAASARARRSRARSGARRSPR